LPEHFCSSRSRPLAFIAAVTLTLAASTGSCTLLSGVDALKEVECAETCEGGGGGANAQDGQDGQNAQDGETAGFCASLDPAPALCADFDEGGGYAAQFPQSNQPGSGHLGVNGAASTSRPDSFFATIDANSSGTQAEAYVSHSFTGQSSKLEYAFDLMLDGYVSGQWAVVAGIRLDAGAPLTLRLVVSSDGAEMEQSFPGADGGLVFVDAPLKPAPTPGVWTRIDITLSLTDRTVTVLVGGVNALASTSVDPTWPTSGALAVDLGFTYVATTSSGWSVRFDDVVVDPH
jgi:hypothetical protein